MGEHSPDWRDNERRFLLVGRPQIGKTGVFLWLVWLLWTRLNNSSGNEDPGEVLIPIQDLIDEGDAEDDETVVQPLNSTKFPEHATLAAEGFLHPPKEAGGYGSMRDPATWRHYFGRFDDGGKSPLPCKPPPPAATGFAAVPDTSSSLNTAQGGSAPTAASAQAVLTSTAASAAAAGPAPAHVRGRWLCVGPPASPPPAEARSAEPGLQRVDLGDVPEHMRNGFPSDALAALEEHGNVGRLSLMQSHVDRDWDERVDGSWMLKDWLRADANARSTRLCIPIFTPSSGRAQEGRHALLDRSKAMVDAQSGDPREYVQIVVVKSTEAEDYRRHWPNLDFFVLPRWADTLGVGAARFCLKRLAERICPRSYPYCLVLDDNIKFFVGVTLVRDSQNLFGGTIPIDAARLCNQPLWEALNYLQDPEFVDLKDFAVLGFHRMGKYTAQLKVPFVRQHVYKCVLLNLNRLEGLDYDAAVWAAEDVDFAKRLVCACFPPPGSNYHGQLCLPVRKPPGRCVSWNGANEIICKIRRFGFYQQRLKGGASGTEEQSKKHPPSKRKQPESTSGDTSDVGAWLRDVLSKVATNEVQAIIDTFEKEEVALEDLSEMASSLEVLQMDQYLEKILPTSRSGWRLKIINALRKQGMGTANANNSDRNRLGNV